MLARALQAADAAAQEVAADPEALRQSFRLLELPPLWVVVLLILPAVLLVAAAGYIREKLPGRVRNTLILLRSGSLVLLLLVLFRPVWVQHQENVRAPEVLVLVDDSASMSRRDAYLGGGEDKDALARATGLAPEAATRAELVQAATEKDLLPVLEENGYQTRLYRFSDGLAPLPGLEDLAARGGATHVGDALVQALRASRGRHVTDVVLISDGKSNGGTGALEAARDAKAAGVPVHTVVVGDTRPESNLTLELVEAPPSVLEGDEVAVIARVTGSGDAQSEPTRVLLEELGAEGDAPRLVAEEELLDGATGERLVLVAPPATTRFDQEERRFRLSVPGQDGETLLDDNVVEFRVRITSERIRVLFIDGYPRWEYRFLNRLLKRSDERIDVQCFLLSASSNFVHESSKGLPALREVPTDRRALLDNYDVIILGDVNPYAISADPAVGEEFVRSLFEFVERGGGLCMIAGEVDNPRSFGGSDFSKLLPVVLDATGGLNFQGDPEVEFRPILDTPGAPHEIVRLHEDLELNRRLWEEPGGLRGFYWYAPVVEAKPGAQVLLRHPSDLGRNGSRTPLLVTGYYPSGRTMFLGVDSTWRWRYRFVDRYHERFWRNAVRWLALGRLKSGDRRFSLEPLRSRYDLAERVTLEARALDEDYRPSEEPALETLLEGPDGPPEPFELVAVDGRPGLYRGSFQAARPGTYRSWIEESGRRVASTEVEVVLPSRENDDPAPDPQTLGAIARLSEGQATSLAQLVALRTEFPGGEELREPISSQLEDAWDQWGTLLAALVLLSAEWILRKRYELV